MPMGEDEGVQLRQIRAHALHIAVDAQAFWTCIEEHAVHPVANGRRLVISISIGIFSAASQLRRRYGR